MSKYLPNYIVDKEYEVPCRGNEAAIYIRTDTDKQLCMCAEIGRERERERTGSCFALPLLAALMVGVCEAQLVHDYRKFHVQTWRQ